MRATADTGAADAGEAAADTAARLRAFAARRRAPVPRLDALDPSGWPEPALAATSLVWRRRVVNEARSVELASELARAYERCALLSAPIEAALARLAEDERSHVELASAFLARIGAKAPGLAGNANGAPDSYVPDEPRDGDRRGAEGVRHAGADARRSAGAHDAGGDAAGTDDASSLLLLRCVATGLAVCETVSAARFAMVRAHTDLAVPRACIELFLRDELAHARLGFALLPGAIAHRARAVGSANAAAELAAELGATFRHLDVVVGLDAERRGIRLEARAQPPCNAGVVEPALDAIALRGAITRTVVPRLARIGVDARAIWSERWRVAPSA